LGEGSRIKLSNFGGGYVYFRKNLLCRRVGSDMVETEAERETQEVIEADFKEKTVRKITVTPDTKPAKFLRDCAKYAKEAKATSVMVFLVTEDNHCDWIMEIQDDHHAALIALTLEDAREEVKAIVFGDEEYDVDE
jgi:hypothetical protein